MIFLYRFLLKALLKQYLLIEQAPPLELLSHKICLNNFQVSKKFQDYFRYGYPCPKGGSGCDDEANNNTNGVLGSGNGTPGLDPYIALWQDTPLAHVWQDASLQVYCWTLRPQ